MNLKSIFNLLFALTISTFTLIYSCSSPDTTNSVNEVADTINYVEKEIRLKEEKIEEEVEVGLEEEAVTELAIYKGSWFEIQYPINFIAYPNEQIDKFEDYTFVKTDEAHFLSPDRSVEFFVYLLMFNIYLPTNF